MTALLGQSIAADWPTYPPRRKAPAMDALTVLAREAGELQPDDRDGLVAATYMLGQWTITVHVDLPDAFAHCDEMHDDNEPKFGVIRVTADTLTAAVAEATRRVAAAVADTPATQIP